MDFSAYTKENLYAAAAIILFFAGFLLGTLEAIHRKGKPFSAVCRGYYCVLKRFFREPIKWAKKKAQRIFFL